MEDAASIAERSPWDVRVRRSVRRAWVAIAVGVMAALVAVDVSFTYLAFPEPEVDENGNRTAQGDSDRRGDIAWGATLGLAAVGLLAWGSSRLGARRSVLTADEAGLTLRLIGSDPVRFHWADVDSVRSAIVDDELGDRHVLEVESSVPPFPVGRDAEWQGSRLLVDAEDWTPPLEVVAGRLATLLARSHQAGGDGAR